jgi:RNA polymerase sigma factor (sigma-70 family)
MPAEDPGSVTRWLDGLKAGQPEAVDALWRRFFERVVAVARRRLQAAPQQSVEDAEDVALSAMHGLYVGAAQGRFEHLSDRVDLWRLLVAITVKKALSRRQWYGRLKRGGDCIIHSQDFAADADTDGSGHEDVNSLNRAASKEPSPESAAIVQEQFQELLDALPDPTLRQIALWRMDGQSNAEIAAKLGCVVRSVERKIERIRWIWEEIGAEPDE